MTRRKIIPGALATAFFLGVAMSGPGLPAAENPPGGSSRHTGVRLDAFVNWDFRHRQKLRAWKTTAFVIRRTLELWYPQYSAASLVENGTPEAFRQFLHALPDEQQCGGVSLVYLASHQSPAGEWDFPEDKLVPLDSLLAGAGIPGNPRRIVILDTCYAAAADDQAAGWKQLAPEALFASPASAETPEANFHSPQPVDFAHRYPAEYAWLKDCLGREWDGKISFLGFIWVQTFLMEKNPPRGTEGWLAFMRQCHANSVAFRDKVSKRSSSEVTLAPD